MVQGVPGAVTGSSSREYGITFEIGPPTAVRPGVPFTLPIVVAVRPVGPPRDPSVQQLVANISLRDETGTRPLPGLTGTVTSSIRSRAGNTTSGYALFAPLTIANGGRYKFRVMLGAASYEGVTTREYIESAVIQVHADAAASQRPTPSQISKLQSLVQENIDISPADIAAWQQA